MKAGQYIITVIHCGGRRMRNVLLALLLTIGMGDHVHAAEAQDFVTVDSLFKDTYPWWMRAQFHPSETQVRGIPVQAIRKTWCKASEFRRELFPAELQDDLKSRNFAIDGFFDGSKSRLTALVGVYETCEGHGGMFVLILGWLRQDPPKHGPPTVRFVSERSTAYPFAVIKALPDSTIVLDDCRFCDDGNSLTWDRSRRRFIWVNSENY
jgi:hypothetical protein